MRPYPAGRRQKALRARPCPPFLQASGFGAGFCFTPFGRKVYGKATDPSGRSPTARMPGYVGLPQRVRRDLHKGPARSRGCGQRANGIFIRGAVRLPIRIPHMPAANRLRKCVPFYGLTHEPIPHLNDARCREACRLILLSSGIFTFYNLPNGYWASQKAAGKRGRPP